MDKDSINLKGFDLKCIKPIDIYGIANVELVWPQLYLDGLVFFTVC